MSSKSKIKGKSFEREVAKQLSILYNDSFRRVIDSGAFVGGKNSSRKATLSEGQIRSNKGDIVPPDDWKFFNAELKNYANFPFHKLLQPGHIALLETWLVQLMDASDAGDLNILIFKVTRIGVFICVPSDAGFKLRQHVVYTDKASRTWAITDFNEFLENNKEIFKNKGMMGT